jgi:hypothetical protein
MLKSARFILVVLGLSLFGNALAVCNNVGLTFTDTNCRWCAVINLTQEVTRTHVVYEDSFGNCRTRISNVSSGPCGQC